MEGNSRSLQLRCPGLSNLHPVLPLIDLIAG